jgi:hypothetical protein
MRMGASARLGFSASDEAALSSFFLSSFFLSSFFLSSFFPLGSGELVGLGFGLHVLSLAASPNDFACEVIAMSSIS